MPCSLSALQRLLKSHEWPPSQLLWHHWRIRPGVCVCVVIQLIILLKQTSDQHAGGVQGLKARHWDPLVKAPPVAQGVRLSQALSAVRGSTLVSFSFTRQVTWTMFTLTFYLERTFSLEKSYKNSPKFPYSLPSASPNTNGLPNHRTGIKTKKLTLAQ